MIRALVAIVLLAFPAWAETPTQDQVRAVRSNCRGDFLKNCASVPRGGAEALACLKNHQDRLSAPCGQAVAAIR